MTVDWEGLKDSKQRNFLEFERKWIQAFPAILASHERDQRVIQAAVQELRNIAEAKRFDKKCFDDDTTFADWAQSRARFTLGEIDKARQ